MPIAAATPGRVLLLCLTGLLALWFLGPFTAQAMDSIPSPFTIKINGKPVERLDESAEDRTPTKVGKDAAVFNLKNNRLQSGDWYMGRDLMENRSYGPKKVSWYKANAENEKRVQPVTAKKEGDAYQLIFKNGMLMVEDEDLVFVDLIGNSQAKVEVTLQER